jgi:hypothetical protein
MVRRHLSINPVGFSSSLAILVGLGAVVGGAAAADQAEEFQIAQAQQVQNEAQQPQHETSQNLRPVNPADIQVPERYRVEVAAKGLNFPSDITFQQRRNDLRLGNRTP